MDRSTPSLAVVAFTFTLGILALLAFSTWSSPPNVFAAGAVGAGSAASCTEAALDSALAGGGLVTFNCGATPVTIVLTSTKQITLSTTIDGGGKVALSGGGAIGVFSNALSSTLTLQNITVTQGFTANGGGVLNFGTLVLSNAAFVSNTATTGGAILNDGTLVVSNTAFLSNTATIGGAIASNGAMVMTGTAFVSGTATLAGGIFNNGVMTANNISFVRGGATTAGALFNNGIVTLSNVSIVSGTANTGGGIFNNGIMTAAGVTLARNSATSGGGAFNNGLLELTGATIVSNSAVTGGFIFNNGTLVLSDTSAISNVARTGGAMYSNGPVTVANSLFASNIATNTGGAMALLGGQADVRNSEFVENHAVELGAAIQTEITTTIASTLFLSNTKEMTVAGGVGVNAFSTTVSIADSRFIGNHTRGPAGASFTDAGGVASQGRTHLEVVNSLFANNTVTAPQSAGGIFVEGSGGTTVISGSTFAGNTGGAGGSGGATLRGAGTLTVENSLFTANSVISNGSGGLVSAFSGQPYTLTVLNSTFSGNSGGSDGAGAVLNRSQDSGQVVLAHSTIVSNVTTGVGHGISVTAESTITLRNSIVAYNYNTNCSPAGAYIFEGFNIQNGDYSCPGVAQIDPRLGELRNNGGPVETHAVLFASPAIDTALALYCPPADARGVPRPSGAGCDVGAFERTVPSLIAIAPTTTVASPVPLTITLTGTNFITGAVALVDGSPRATSFISGTLLTATLIPTDTLTARILAISIRNPGEGEGPTASLPLSVTTRLFVPAAATTYRSNW